LSFTVPAEFTDPETATVWVTAPLVTCAVRTSGVAGAPPQAAASAAVTTATAIPLNAIDIDPLPFFTRGPT
jgi:hypothetical protein